MVWLPANSLLWHSWPMNPLADVQDMAAGLRDEARAFSVRSSRSLMALRHVFSVAIAVMAAHALGLHDAWWAAISAFTVMQANVGASAWRGLLRIFGTVCGGTAAFLLGPHLSGHPVASALLIGAVSWAGLFAALVSRYSYAWVLGLITFVIVVCEALVAHTGLAHFALERVANVVIGTLACVLVAALSERRFAVTIPGNDPDERPPERTRVALHALQGALAVALLTASLSLHDLRAFPQAMVTTIAVLIVPLGGQAIDAQASVMHRMVQRVTGCLLAGAIALAVLPFIQQHALWCQTVLALGVWIGAYLQSGPINVRYLAVQLSFAFLIIFVQDRGWVAQSGPALQRLGGVLAGVAALALVFSAFWLFRRIARRH